MIPSTANAAMPLEIIEGLFWIIWILLRIRPGGDVDVIATVSKTGDGDDMVAFSFFLGERFHQYSYCSSSGSSLRTSSSSCCFCCWDYYYDGSKDTKTFLGCFDSCRMSLSWNFLLMANEANCHSEDVGVFVNGSWELDGLVPQEPSMRIFGGGIHMIGS